MIICHTKKSKNAQVRIRETKKFLKGPIQHLFKFVPARPKKVYQNKAQPDSTRRVLLRKKARSTLGLNILSPARKVLQTKKPDLYTALFIIFLMASPVSDWPGFLSTRSHMESRITILCTRRVH